MMKLYSVPHSKKNQWFNFDLNLETDSKKYGQDQKLAFDKRSTIFEQSSWNLVKITNPWGGPLDQVSWW